MPPVGCRKIRCAAAGICVCPSVDSPRSSSRKRPLARPKKVEVEEGEVTSSDEEVNEAVAGADLTSMVSTPPLEAPAEEEAPAKEEADGAPYVCWTSSLKESVLVGAKETALATASLIELKELAVSISMKAAPPGHKHRKQVNALHPSHVAAQLPCVLGQNLSSRPFAALSPDVD